MAHAESVAASHGYAQFALYTNVLMASNVRLYEKLGHSKEREERFDGGVAVHMRKCLTPA